MVTIKSQPPALNGNPLSMRSKMADWNSILLEMMQRAFSLLKYGTKLQRQYAQLMYLPLPSYSRVESNFRKVADVKLVDLQQEVPFAHTIKAESVIVMS
jgi:hypothetical protein